MARISVVRASERYHAIEDSDSIRLVLQMIKVTREGAIGCAEKHVLLLEFCDRGKN